MGYVLVEVSIYLTWAYVFLSRLRGSGRSASEEMHVLVFALPTTIIMELRVEYLFGGTNTYYPSSLLYFPNFKFPVAIVFAGSLYTWSLYVLSRAVSARIPGQITWPSHLVQLTLFLLLIFSSYYVEWLFVSIGYWQWYTPPDPRGLWLGSYYWYYFWFAFPAALAAKFFLWHGSRVSANSK